MRSKPQTPACSAAFRRSWGKHRWRKPPKGVTTNDASANLWVAFLFLALLPASSRDVLAQNDGDDKQLVREIYVPYEDLNVLLESEVRRAFLTREEYNELLAKAKETKPDEPAPHGAVILAADYETTIEEGRARLKGVLDIEVLDEGLHALPLDLAGVGVRSATMAGKSAAIGLNEAGQAVLFVEGEGHSRLELEMVAPVQTSAAQQTLDFRLPTPAATRMRVTVPGNVEVKSGAKLVSRTVDEAAGVTRFEMLPTRGQMSLVMSLNNRMLRRQRVVVARSILVDEVTVGYERLHATVSLDVLHGAADSLRFTLPDGFEPTEVQGPQVSRWVVNEADGQRVLEVILREAATETVILNLSATRTPTRMADWTMPKLVPLDVAGQVAVVGLVVEDRLKTESLAYQGLIPVDNGSLAPALPESIFRVEPGAPRVRQVAAYYAPGQQYSLAADFRKPPERLEVTTNLLLILEETGHRVHGGFSLLPEVEKLFAVRFSIPTGWHIDEVTDVDGNDLPMERYDDPQGESVVHVRLPRGVPPGEVTSVLFKAFWVPAEWLGNWPQQRVEFPRFVVQGTARDIGAIAVRADDDFVVRPDELTGVLPLDEKEKGNYGLGGVESSLAYRYDGQPYQATMTVTRQTPTITARSFSFLHIAPGSLTAHYEIIYDIQQARTRRLSLLLPKDTPTSLLIAGLDGVTVKVSNEETDDGRRWTAQLAEATTGAVRLAVDFQMPLGDKDLDDYDLPLAQAGGVAYQSAVVAVEGSAELDITVNTDARRVDVGELVAAQYRVGRRLLGAFEFVGAPKEVTVDVNRRPGYEIATAIVQRAELVTLLSTDGLAQTSARYQLRTKAHFLEVKLPPNHTLWSVYLDGKPVGPQQDGDSLLLSLPATNQIAMRDLQIVYETPAELVTLMSDVRAEAPVLLLRDTRDAEQREVPAADVKWELVLPAEHQVVDSHGTVFTDLPERESPIWNALGALYGLLGGIHSPMQAAREAARSADSRGYLNQSGQAYYLRDDVQFDTSESMSAPAALVTQSSDEMTVDATDMDMPMEATDPAAEPKSDAPPAEGMEEAGAAEEEEPEMPTPDAARGEPGAQPQAGEAIGQPGPPQDAPVTGRQGTAPQQEGKRTKFWALEGVRSLKIDLQQIEDEDTPTVTFQSLGVRPMLGVTLVNENQIESLAWGVASLIFVIGVLLTRRSVRAKAKYVIVVALAALVVTDWVNQLGDTFDFAFYAACLLVPYYLVAGVLRWLAHKCCSCCCAGVTASAGQAAAGALLLALALATASTTAFAQAPKPPVFDPAGLIELLKPPKPVTLPKDAVIIPYNADDGAEGIKDAEKVLVPYEKYVELWNRAFPDQKLEAKPPVVPYSLAGAAFDATLAGDEYLLLTGHLDFDIYSDKEVQIPLHLAGGVLASAILDGKPARLQIVQPAVANQPDAANAPAQQAPQPAPNAQAQVAQSEAQITAAPPGCFALLYASGEGRKRLELAVRIKLERRGGWRVASGRVPAAPATALTLTVPAAETEVSITGISDRGDYETTADNEQIVTALSADREFKIEWRPKVAEGQVDRSLTVSSEAVLDVQEDGLRLIWRLNLQFPRSHRDAFAISIPADYLVEKVVGDNVRGWQVQPDDDRQRLDVTLLDEASDGETVTLHLSRRGVVQPDAATELDAPVVLVPDAALHKGRLTIRRSLLLDLQIENVTGLPRTDIPADAIASVQEGAPVQGSALGLQPYQTYNFSTAPFTVRLTAKPVVSETSATLRTLLRIAERETTLESQVTLDVDRRPVHRVRLYIPDSLELDSVSAPGDFDWTVTNEGGRGLLSIYLGAGRDQPFSLQIFGSLGRRQAADPVPAPKLEVLDVASQQGDIVVQIDPAFDVTATGLKECEVILLEDTFGWLQTDQQSASRLALRYEALDGEAPDYDATFEITPRQADVSGHTITNVMVTDVAIEETIIVDLTIRKAGIREVSFLLPDWMEKARVKAPLLRQKTIEDAGDGWKRFRLELQEETKDQYRVVVENDRLLMTSGDDAALPEAPIPVLETGSTDVRYVTLENAGRDELLVGDQVGVERLNRQQTEWRKLAAILGEGITTAFIVKGDATSPKLSFNTKQRKTVETAGAQIGLAETLLIVDANGAYRGQQTYHVNNMTEQFLEIRLPDGARLWTATVSEEPVKPTEVPGGQSPNLVRIPLIKTAEGDLDYLVVLKYGGHLRRVGTYRQVSFPLIHTENINVELSQVRLRLPETHRWFDFGGTMRRVYEEGTYQAGFFLYNKKQANRLKQVLAGSNPYAKLRSASNLKQIGLAQQNYHDTYRGFIDSNAEFNKNYIANAAVVVEAQKQAEEFLVQEGEAVVVGNRDRLNSFWMGQDNGLARNVVTDLSPNFTMPQPQDAQPQAGNETLGKWIASNKLERKTKQSQKDIEARFQSKMPQQQVGGKLKGLAAEQQLLQSIAAQDQKPMGQEQAEGQGRAAQTRSGTVARSQKELTKQYQDQLERDNTQSDEQGQAWRDNGAQFRGPGLSAGGGQAARVDDEGGASVNGLAMSPDSTRLATAASDGRTTVWEVDAAPAQGIEHHLASLDVDLPDRGVEFMFTTPRGEVEITARAVSAPITERLAWLFAIAVAIVVLYVVYRFARRIVPWLVGSQVGASLLFLAGVFSLLFGLFPIAALAAFVVGIVQLIRLSITNRRRRRERAPAAT
ncbi:MAG: hypothetical protein H8E44_22240 [Planctomycetes bacterium]|nr:hypothetical protein [Planctomycetota bacterium]